MSEYATINTEFRDKTALLFAMRAMGIETRECEQPERMRDYFGQLSNRTADIIGARGSRYTYDQANGNSRDLRGDVGFTRQENGSYSVQLDHCDNPFMSALKREYAFQAIRFQQAAQGRQVARTWQGNRQIVTVTGYRG